MLLINQHPFYYLETVDYMSAYLALHPLFLTQKATIILTATSKTCNSNTINSTKKPNQQDSKGAGWKRTCNIGDKTCLKSKICTIKGPDPI